MPLATPNRVKADMIEAAASAMDGGLVTIEGSAAGPMLYVRDCKGQPLFWINLASELGNFGVLPLPNCAAGNLFRASMRVVA